MVARDISELLTELPEHLKERVLNEQQLELNLQGECVIYWMRSAQRSYDNPSLDCAIHFANHLRLPLIVYFELLESYPFSCDRKHIFQLEGTPELAKSFSELGIPFFLHVERKNCQGSQLKDLAGKAALIVTDLVPLAWQRDQIEQLRNESSHFVPPILQVDSSCVFPMNLAKRFYERAFRFREDLFEEQLRRARLSWDSPSLQVRADYDRLLSQIANPSFVNPIYCDDFDSLIADCNIDHSVTPVFVTRGGMASAASRWQEFYARGLDSYADMRNDAALVHGVSRMSAYLHFGQISPFQIAREASDRKSKGSQKYLDELLVWRELAFNLCFSRQDYKQPSVIPNWAVETLKRHQNDSREVLSLERLLRGKTGDALWDAAQLSLLEVGELHNNLRMTWAKAIVGWTKDLSSSMRTLEILNNRLALDGDDPASYGGLWWALGLYDRPFQPARPVIGTTRPRWTRDHRRRLDPGYFSRAIEKLTPQKSVRVAVIGAGMAGLSLARTLMDNGFYVTVFDKGYRPGGRLASRHRDAEQFDYGAQYFTARHPYFRGFVESWLEEGVAAVWQGRVGSFVDGNFTQPDEDRLRYVGTPSMDSISAHLACELESGGRLRQGHHVRAIEFDPDRCTYSLQGLLAEGNKISGAESSFREDGFDYVVINMPPAQANALAPHPLLTEIELAPCWAVMLSFSSPIETVFDGAIIREGALSWVARDSSKPGRPEGERWVLHASPDWSEAMLEETAVTVQEMLISVFQKIVGVAALPPVLFVRTHRWRYALPRNPLDCGFLFDSSKRLGYCGDWLAGDRLEGAFMSGVRLAGRIAAHAQKTFQTETIVSGAQRRIST